MWSDREVGRWFDYYVDRAEERIYKLLQRAGEEFVKIARKKGMPPTGNVGGFFIYTCALKQKKW